MLSKIFRTIFSVIGMIIGYLISNVVMTQPWFETLIGRSLSQTIRVATNVIFILILGILFFILFPLLHNGLKKLAGYIEESLDNVRVADIIVGVAGLAVGLLLALVISFAISLISIPWLVTLLSVVVYIALGYLGFTIALHKRDEILSAIERSRKEKEAAPVATTAPAKKSRKKNTALSKVLDTSSLIDGRIADVMHTGFIEGQLVVPTFVLEELQLLADSSDDLKRLRGRRGLEMLQKMQADFGEDILISELDFPELTGVDAKLVKLAKARKMAIVTTDFNLNQVATVQGVPVLNVNELSGALKPVVMIGEHLNVLPVKNGKEPGQAVAYLDDGTMIVIENGRKFIGEPLRVVVTSVLQNLAGRMIFVKPEQE